MPPFVTHDGLNLLSDAIAQKPAQIVVSAASASDLTSEAKSKAHTNGSREEPAQRPLRQFLK